MQRLRKRKGGVIDMAKQTHTPGPWTWQVDDVHEPTESFIYAPGMDNIGTIYNKADTLLVAAAPELLEACRAAQRLFYEALPKFNWAKSFLDANAIALLNNVPAQVNRAIAKAEGEAE